MNSSKNGSIDLKGSARSITEFFEYCISSILYQRGVYPAEEFSTVKKYDLMLVKSIDEELKLYIRKILGQVHRWLLGGKCNQLVICIVDIDEGDVVERWAFSVHQLTEDEMIEEVSLEQTQKQIQSLIRQVTASVTFLPELSDEHEHSFNVLAYTDADAKVPLEWADSSSQEIENGEVVQLKKFQTGNHQVGTQVSYRL